MQDKCIWLLTANCLLATGYFPMAPIAKWWIFCLLALTKPYLLSFFETRFKAFKWHPFNMLVLTITKRLLLTQSAGTPRICFTCFCLRTGWFAFCNPWKILVWNNVHYSWYC